MSRKQLFRDLWEERGKARRSVIREESINYLAKSWLPVLWQPWCEPGLLFLRNVYGESFISLIPMSMGVGGGEEERKGDVWKCSWYQHQCLSHVNKVTFVCQLSGLSLSFIQPPHPVDGLNWTIEHRLISRSTSWTVRLVFSWWWSPAPTLLPLLPFVGVSRIAHCCVFIMNNVTWQTVEREDDGRGTDGEEALMGITIVFVLSVLSYNGLSSASSTECRASCLLAIQCILGSKNANHSLPMF